MERHQISESPAPNHVQTGITLLKQAFDYAHDVNCDVWEFAVEFPNLRDAGLFNNDLRWLAWKGYIQYGREITGPGDKVREFLRDEPLVFTKRTCFVLTRRGASECGTLVKKVTRFNGTNGHASRMDRGLLPSKEDRQPLRPTWDRDRHQLRLGEQLIKEFKLHSPCQKAILSAFEEEGWPPRIDDPLIPQPESEPKERLRNTIKSLNRKQIHRLIRFMGDGTGEAVRWELVTQPLNDEATH